MYTAVFSFCGIQFVFHPVSVKVHWFVEDVEKLKNLQGKLTVNLGDNTYSSKPSDSGEFCALHGRLGS